MSTPTYTYTLGTQHPNTINDPVLGADLPCDGTVKIYGIQSKDPGDPTGGAGDAVCYATVQFTIGNTKYDQNIMNVPFQDAVRLPLYLDYFVNDQSSQITG